MTDGQRDLFGFVGAAFATMIGLFVVQELAGSFADVSLHAALADAGMFPELAVVRDAEKKKLASGKVPIDQAMRMIAERGRAGIRSVAPAPSEDLSPMTGWIHRHHFEVYVPRLPTTPEAAPVAPSEGPPSAAPEATPVAAPALAPGEKPSRPVPKGKE